MSDNREPLSNPKRKPSSQGVSEQIHLDESAGFAQFESLEYSYEFSSAQQSIVDVTTFDNQTQYDDLFHAIETCLIANDDAAWQKLIALIRPLLESGMRRSYPREARTLIEYFPGWLYSKRKLPAAYRRIIKGRLANEFASPKEEVSCLRNYLYKMIESAAADWFDAAKPTPFVFAEPTASREDLLERVLEVKVAVRRLDREIRLPFWLRHYVALGPLDEEDLAFVAQLNQKTAQEIGCCLEEQISTKFSSAFIGQLLHIPPRSNGKYDAVDQRIFRAKRLLIRQLSDISIR